MYRYYRFNERNEKVHGTAWEHCTDEGWTVKGQMGLTVAENDDSMKALENVTISMLQTVRLNLFKLGLCLIAPRSEGGRGNTVENSTRLNMAGRNQSPRGAMKVGLGVLVTSVFFWSFFLYRLTKDDKGPISKPKKIRK